MSDYQRARQDGAYLHIDADMERLLLLAATFSDDPSFADEGDEGVLAVYRVFPDALLADILDALAAAGIDVDAVLRRVADEHELVLPRLRIATPDTP